MLRPSPVPPRCRVEVVSAWLNFSKIRAWKSGGIPLPRSVTRRRANPFSAVTPTSTTPPDGENLTAFDSRLLSTCCMRSGSTRTGTRADSAMHNEIRYGWP